jgi:cytosine/adenosine deaminase-related metal-dependent hydrolase
MDSLTRRLLLRHTAAVVTTGIVPGGLALFAHPSAMKAAQQRAPVGSLPARGEFVIRGAYVMTMDPVLGDIAGGDIHVKDGSIVAVGKALNAPAATAISGERMIVLPGLVETHWHMWNTLLRGFSGDRHEESYFPMLVAVGKFWTPADTHLGTRLGAVEAIDSGITTVHNWSHMLPAPEFADAELMALADAGIRARFSYGWSPLLAETQALPLADVERLNRDWAKFANGGLIHLGLGWRGIWRFGKRSPETVYRREFELARGIGIPIALHVPGVRNSPKVVEMHDKEGFLGKDVLIAHATWVTADEIRMLKDAESSVSLSPVTDARVGYGFAPTSELIDGGVNCCLSIDTTVETGTCSLFENMKYLVNLENGRFGDEFKMLPRKALELATINGARALGLADHIGTLSPGKRADLIMVSTRGVNMGLLSDPAHLLVESATPTNVDTVVVDGRILKQNGKLTHIDVEGLTDETAAAFDSLRKRANWRSEDFSKPR